MKQKTPNKPYWIIIAAVIVVAILAVILIARPFGSNTPNETEQPTQETTETDNSGLILNKLYVSGNGKTAWLFTGKGYSENSCYAEEWQYDSDTPLGGWYTIEGSTISICYDVEGFNIKPQEFIIVKGGRTLVSADGSIYSVDNELIKNKEK